VAKRHTQRLTPAIIAPMTANIIRTRPFAAADRAAWDTMWAAYLAFYETALPPETSADTWARFLTPAPSTTSSARRETGSDTIWTFEMHTPI